MEWKKLQNPEQSGCAQLVLLIHFGNGSQFNKQNEWCARVKGPGLMLSFKYTSERGDWRELKEIEMIFQRETSV